MLSKDASLLAVARRRRLASSYSLDCATQTDRKLKIQQENKLIYLHLFSFQQAMNDASVERGWASSSSRSSAFIWVMKSQHVTK